MSSDLNLFGFQSLKKDFLNGLNNGSDDLTACLKSVRDFCSMSGNDDAVKAISEMISIMESCDKNNLASSLSKLSKFLNHKEPIVKMCAVVCIIKLFEKALQILTDPGISSSEKISFAKEMQQVLKGDLKDHLNLFGSDDIALIEKVMQLVSSVLSGDIVNGLDVESTYLKSGKESSCTNQLFKQFSTDIQNSLENLERIRGSFRGNDTDGFTRST